MRAWMATRARVHWRIAKPAPVFLLLVLLSLFLVAGVCPYDPYHSPTYFHSSGLSRCERFADHLSWDYDFLNPGELVTRYDLGDSPLTPQVVQLTLKNAFGSAQTLKQASLELERLVTDYGAGRLDSAEFPLQGRSRLVEIQEAAKKIRKDYYLGFIDQRRDAKFKIEKLPASSIQQLLPLVERLSQLSSRIEEGIRAFYQRDMTRVVSVHDLDQPSFRSLSKAVASLAQTIQKSIGRVATPSDS